MTSQVYKLAVVLAAAFIVPVISYLVGLAWSNSVAKIFGVPPNPRLRKWLTTVYLGFPIWALATYVHLGYDGLREWWIQSPVLVTAVALLLLVLVPALLLWAIIRLWRGAERPRSHHEEDNEG